MFNTPKKQSIFKYMHLSELTEQKHHRNSFQSFKNNNKSTMCENKKEDEMFKTSILIDSVHVEERKYTNGSFVYKKSSSKISSH